MIPVVLALVLAALAFCAVSTKSPPDRWLAIMLIVALLVAWFVYRAGIDDPPLEHGASSGNRVTAQAAGPPLVYPDFSTISTVPAERTAPTPPASVSPRGETTSGGSAGTAVTGDLGVFKVTCYGPPRFPAGQTTASGDPVGPGSIAVDPSVIPMGTVLEVEGYGRGVANDRGSAVRGRHVDIWRADPYNDCAVRSARVWVVE